MKSRVSEMPFLAFLGDIQYRREGGGVWGGNYPGARAQEGPAKNSVYEDILYIIIIITNLPLGPRKTLVS